VSSAHFLSLNLWLIWISFKSALEVALVLPWIEMALCGRGAQIAMVNLALEILIREHILNLFLISNTNLSVKFHVVEPLLLLLVDLETQTKNKECL
jgi:hypothetical protein